MATRPGRNDARWVELRSRLRKTLAPVCWYCGEGIDLSLSGRHPRGWSLDHVEPIHEAPHRIYDETNLRPAHMKCNADRGGKQQVMKISQKWGSRG